MLWWHFGKRQVFCPDFELTCNVIESSIFRLLHHHPEGMYNISPVPCIHSSGLYSSFIWGRVYIHHVNDSDCCESCVWWLLWITPDKIIIIIMITIIMIIIIIIIIIMKNLNLLLIRKLTTKSGLFTIKFCLKKLSSTSTIYNSFRLKKPT